MLQELVMFEFGLREPNSGMPPAGSLNVMRGTMEMGRALEKADAKPSDVASKGEDARRNAAWRKRVKPTRTLKIEVDESVVVESTTTPLFLRTSGPCWSMPRPMRLLPPKANWSRRFSTKRTKKLWRSLIRWSTRVTHEWKSSV